MDQAVALDGRAVDSSCLDYDYNRAGTDSNDLSCDFVDIHGLANLDAAAYWERAVSQNPKQENRNRKPKRRGVETTREKEIRPVMKDEPFGCQIPRNK